MNVAWVLLKKEIHGVVWKSAALSAIAVAIVIGGRYVSFVPILSSPLHDSLVVALAAHAVFGGLFLAMHVTATEQADGTIEFVRSLPVPLWVAGAIRVLVTWLAFLATFALCGLAALLVMAVDQHLRPGSTGLPQAKLWHSVLVAMLGGSTFHLATVCLAMNQKTELRAGAIGLGVFAASLLSGLLGPAPLALLSPVGVLAWDVFVRETLRTPTPEAFSLAEPKAMASVAFLLLAFLTIAVWRYGRPEWGGIRPAYNRSPGWAWARFHLTQSWPLGVATLALTLLLVVSAAGAPVEQVVVATSILGGVWSIVAGVTLYISDLEPRLSAFWRSRPIPPETWFWTKLASGAAMLLVLDLPMSVRVAMMGNATFVLFILFHAAVLALAVLWTCLIRQPIYSGILAFATGAGLMFSLFIDRPGLRIWPAVEQLSWALSNVSTPGMFGSAILPLMLAVGLIAAIVFAARWAAVRDVSFG